MDVLLPLEATDAMDAANSVAALSNTRWWSLLKGSVP
jgi:hypothetical protein